MDCLMEGSCHSDTLTYTKVEIEEHDTLSGIKVEPYDVLQYHKPDTFGNIIGKHSTNIDTAKYKLGIIYSAVVVKTEHDPSEFEHGHTKEEPDVDLQNETSSNSNFETHFGDVDAGPSSSCELKSEEVHFDVLKMEEDQYTASNLTEMEDERSGDLGMPRSKHKMFNCVKCEVKFSSKRSLDGHIVRLHSNEADMMKTVTCKIRRCNHCPYVTVYGSRISQHKAMHGNPLDCTKCKTEFSSKLSLDSHIVSQHTDDAGMMRSVTSKICHCNRCTYMTVYASRMTQHIRMHDNQLDCTKCKTEFSSKSCLDGHIVSQHNDDAGMMRSVTSKIHRCNRCTYMTVYAGSLYRHIWMH